MPLSVGRASERTVLSIAAIRNAFEEWCTRPYWLLLNPYEVFGRALRMFAGEPVMRARAKESARPPIALIGTLIAHRELDHWAVDAIGAPHVGERPEKELISSFVDRIADDAAARHVQR
jgi:hypothetical protein